MIQDYINKSKGEFSIFQRNSLCFESSSSYTDLLKASAEILHSFFFNLYFLSTPKSYNLFYLSIATSLEKTIISLLGYHSKAQSYRLLFLLLSLSTYNPVSIYCSKGPLKSVLGWLSIEHKINLFFQDFQGCKELNCVTLKDV